MGVLGGMVFKYGFVCFYVFVCLFGGGVSRCIFLFWDCFVCLYILIYFLSFPGLFFGCMFMFCGFLFFVLFYVVFPCMGMGIGWCFVCGFVCLCLVGVSWVIIF